MTDIQSTPVSTYLAEYFASQSLRLDVMDPTCECFVSDARHMGAGDWVDGCLTTDDGTVQLTPEIFDAKNAELGLANRFAEQFLVRRIKSLAEEVLCAWDGSDLKNGVVVDLGCDDGLFLLCLAKRYPDCQFIGIDASYAAIDRALERAHQLGVTNVSFYAMTVEQYLEQEVPLSADAVFSLYLWEDCFDLDLLAETHDLEVGVFRGIADLLKPTGYWISMDKLLRRQYRTFIEAAERGGLFYVPACSTTLGFPAPGIQGFETATIFSFQADHLTDD